MNPAGDIAGNPSCDAMAEAAAVILALADIEPDLGALPEALATVSVVTFAPDRRALAWRRLYLSIYQLPRRVVLVGSIDNTPELAGLADDTAGLLIVETDAMAVSTAELLPRGTQWRSFTEFGAGLDAEDRVALATALVNGLQPASVLILGSGTGWEMLMRHGNALRGNTTLFGAVAATPELPVTDLLGTYLRRCMPSLSVLYGPDEQALKRVAALFGLAQADRVKLRAWRDARNADGFLATSGTGV